MTPNTAENATAGVAVAPERIWATVNGASIRLPDGVRQFIGGWSEDPTRPRAVEYVKASALDTARAEIERLRERLRDIIDERDNLSTIVATEIDDVAGAELDDLEARAETAESALTAAQERIAELEGAGAGVIKSWDDRQHGEIEQLKHSDEGGFDYWSPRASMVSSEAIAALRATLSPAVKEPK